MIGVTASGLERVTECPASAILPRASERTQENTRGSERHMFIELSASHGRDKALKFLAEKGTDENTIAICEAMDLERLPLELAHEVAFAFDIANGQARELGRGLNRKYKDLAPFEIAGTADIVGVSDDSVFVGDYKPAFLPLTPARENLQLRFLALCAARAYGKDEARIELVRLKDDGSSWREPAELDLFDLDETAASLRSLPGRVDQARILWQSRKSPDVSQGPWCRYCPAFHSCPAKTSLALQLASGSFQRTPGSRLTPEIAGEAYFQLKAAEELIAKVRKVIYAMAKESPIELPNGMMLGEIVKAGNEKLDGQNVFDVLKFLHNEDVAKAAVKLTTTKKAIDAALRPVVSTLAPEVRRVLDAVRKAGGASKKDRKVIEEFPKAKLTE